MNTDEPDSDTIDSCYPWQESLWQKILSHLANKRLAHALLFTGEQGIGKFHFANALARTMLCQARVNANVVACGICRGCQLSGHGTHPDLLMVRPTDGSRDIKVEQIRRVSEFVSKSSHSGGPKLAILERAECLNSSAANALLKTLEEPTSDTYLLLVSHLPGRLMATIRSRCQRVEFSLPDTRSATSWLSAQVNQSLSDAGSLLAAAKGRPIQAVELASSDGLAQHQLITDNILKVLNKSIGPSEFVSKNKKLQVDLVVSKISDITGALLRYSLANEQNTVIDNAVLQYAQARQEKNTANSKYLRYYNNSLLKLYTKCEEGIKQLQSVSNPNPQLILEDIGFHLAKLANQQN